MISLQEAQAIIRKHLAPARPVSVALGDALGLFLGETLVARRPAPPCDNSAMDGFAVRSEDIIGANRDRPSRLRVIGTSAAGSRTELVVRAREAVRIWTGAPLPEGADCVVRQEATSGVHNTDVDIYLFCEPGKNVRRLGEEMNTGDAIATPGTPLRPAALGLIASFGYAEIACYPRPRLALLTIGDELVQPGQATEPHQLYDSNSVLAAGLVQESGARVSKRMQAIDDDEAIGRTLNALRSDCDMLVTVGGASVGERDRTKGVLRNLGCEFLFDRVALKPGLPAAFGRWKDIWVFVLPGNPGAAVAAFDQLVRPAIHRFQGVREERETMSLPLGVTITKQPNVTQVLAGRITKDEEMPRLWIRPQGAGHLRQHLNAQGWVYLPAGRGGFEPTDSVVFESFSSSCFVSDP